MRKTFLFCLSVGFCAGAMAASPLSLGNHKNNAPIDITSDTLEVFQEENRAVFAGHVVAIQGEMRLKSDKMTVYYRKPEEKSKSAKSDQRDAIRKIDVDGNVFLATPEETASGAAGVYDVENREIRLNDKVVLTKNKNTLKGDHLVYNLDTGKSVVTGGASAAEGQGKTRVRALFVPENGQKK